MTIPADQLHERLTLDRYPRSAKYPARWVVDNLMGPNPLWLAEALQDVMPLAPGMRVLDMGCGTALTSIFLAKEFDVQVWAVDKWIKPTGNLTRIQEQGVADRVFPIFADAHSLPFAEGFFDAAVSYDAYHYFGTDECYLRDYVKFLRPGGVLGIVVPGRRIEPGSDPDGFHSPQWWRRHWMASGVVSVDRADMLLHGYDDWLLWNLVCNEDAGKPEDAPDVGMLRADSEHSLGFTRVVAHKLDRD